MTAPATRPAFAFLAIALLVVAPSTAGAAEDCAACLERCANKRVKGDYPAPARGSGSAAVKHNDVEAGVLFDDARQRDPAFGGTDLRGAIKGYRAAAQVDPGNAQYRNYLAAALMQNRAWTDAAIQLEKARELVPTEPKYLVNLGYAYHRAGNETRALVQYLRAQQLDSRNVRAHLFAGYALSLLGLYDDARGEMRRVLLLDPDNAEAKRVLVSLGQR
jgi:tetratricopeptide (TPR) repeat protein